MLLAAERKAQQPVSVSDRLLLLFLADNFVLTGG
jgi:hypothetical protein